MFTQIGVFLVDAVASFFVFMLLARFHFQWLRVPFRNPVGEFVLATTNWIVVPAGRVPGLPATSPACSSPGWSRA
jgi:YggT family protein